MIKELNALKDKQCLLYTSLRLHVSTWFGHLQTKSIIFIKSTVHSFIKDINTGDLIFHNYIKTCCCVKFVLILIKVIKMIELLLLLLLIW